MFGDKLKELRKQHGITQEQLAAAIGVERSAVGHYEGKKASIPSDDVKKKIAEFFNVSLDYLMDYQSHPSKKAIKEQPFILSSDEKYLISSYRNLNDQAKGTFIAFARPFLNDPQNKKDTPKTGTV